MTTSKPVEVLSRRSGSLLDEVYASPGFQVAWDNEVPLHIAKNVSRLRRFRRMSQAKVGAAMGTSQPAVARIESAQENITLDTLERLVKALKGRFYVSIAPEELAVRRPSPWWELIEAQANPWALRLVALRKTSQSDQVFVGLERMHGTQPGAEDLFIEEAK